MVFGTIFTKPCCAVTRRQPVETQLLVYSSQRLKIRGDILEGHVNVGGQGQHVAVMQQFGETS